jgi:hypothetical protein
MTVAFAVNTVPRRGFITKMEWKGNRLVASGEIEVIETVQ